MSSRAGHPRLSSAAAAWVVAMSDPSARASYPSGPLRARELPALLDAVSAHGVLPVVARNLRSLMASDRSRRTIDNAAAMERTIDELDRRLVLLSGQQLALSHYAGKLAAAFVQEKIPANIVKGPVFARRLYPRPVDRSFTDLDILIDPAFVAATAPILRQLGFKCALDDDAARRSDSEIKWIMAGSEHLLIEVQTDLIHSPTLGAGIRFCRGDLLAAGAGDPEDATALLLTAAVHAAAGHQFERLQTLVDVLQAARGAAGPIDRDRLARVAHSTGSVAAVQSALDLAAGLFHEPAARDLAGCLPSSPWRHVRRRLVSPDIAVRAQDRSAGLDSWRRKALRVAIRRSGESTIREIS
jgi:Uncharacterised nucleotidyltransferase